MKVSSECLRRRAINTPKTPEPLIQTTPLITTMPFPAEPDFVGSALVRESSGSKEGDDDKIYFFFSERALELDCDTELMVARVARICKVKTSCSK